MNKAQLLIDIKQAEGFRSEAYKDTKGFWTGGYGHFLDQSKDWTGQKFSIDIINGWLSNDVELAWARARLLAEWPSLDCDPRQNAVVELVFNMGLGTWREFFHAREAMEHKEWQMAYDQLLDSTWAKQVQPQGFTKPGRATRVATYVLRGSFT